MVSVTTERAQAAPSRRRLGIGKAALGAAFVIVGGCAGGPPGPPPTFTAAPAERVAYHHPRSQAFALLPLAGPYACLQPRIEQALHGRGIKLRPAPSAIEPPQLVSWLAGLTALPDAQRQAWQGWRALSVTVEAQDGPGSSWNPWNGSIRSAHGRTDIHLAILDPESARPLWQASARTAEVLGCADPALAALVERTLGSIE